MIVLMPCFHIHHRNGRVQLSEVLKPQAKQFQCIIWDVIKFTKSAFHYAVVAVSIQPQISCKLQYKEENGIVPFSNGKNIPNLQCLLSAGRRELLGDEWIHSVCQTSENKI